MRKWKPAQLLVVLAGLSILPVAWLLLRYMALRRVEISPQERTELLSSVDQAVASGKQRGQVRSSAMAVMGKWVPRPDLGPCPIEKLPPATDLETIWSTQSDAFGQGGVSWWQAMSELESWHFRLEHRTLLRTEYTHDELMKAVRASIALIEGEYDYRLVIDEKVNPTVDESAPGQRVYKSGSLKGRLLLWSHVQKRVVCAGRAQAVNSGRVSYMRFPDEIGTDNAAASMLGNLLDEAVRSGLSQLYTAGPPPPPATDAAAPAR